MRQLYLLCPVFCFFLLVSCVSGKRHELAKNDPDFSMVFMTDIHLQPELNAVEGFRKAMDSVNRYKPDFVITGGDLIMDALAVKQERADSLFELYNREIKALKMPVQNTIGNHELFGVYEKSGIDSSHELYGNKMYKKKIGKTYYAFTHKNWKFFVLEAVAVSSDRKYSGYISADQISWIKKEIFNTNTKTPIAIISHIPFLTSLTQFKKGALASNGKGLVVENSREILDLFAGYNLRLVLQGHLHILEDNYIGNIHFITGGAVCGSWWNGPHEGTREGFLYLKFSGEDINWKYVEYGWRTEFKNQ